MPQAKYPTSKGGPKKLRKNDKIAGEGFVRDLRKCLTAGRVKDQGRRWKTKSGCLVRQG